MPNATNVWNQALKRRRRREAGDLSDVRKQFFYWLRVVDDGVESAIDDGSPGLAIKWLHCGAQIAGSYLKVLEIEDFEARLKRIEENVGTKDKRKG